MDEQALIDWAEVNDPYLVEEEDVLDGAELNRLACLAEHPERCDPVFLLTRGNRRRGGGGR